MGCLIEYGNGSGHGDDGYGNGFGYGDEYGIGDGYVDCTGFGCRDNYRYRREDGCGAGVGDGRGLENGHG